MKTDEELSISIVDDDELFLTSLKHFLLEKLHNRIRINLFHTGEEFLKDLSDQKPDIVILDYILNSSRPYAMNGHSVLQKIKQTDPEVTVIMLSGQNRIEVALTSIKDGAYDYIIKNDTVFFKTQMVLKNVIKTVLASKQLKRYNRWLMAAIMLLGTGVLIAFLLNLFFKNS